MYKSYTRLIVSTAAALFLTMATLPQLAAAHSVLPPTDQTLTLLEERCSGPYRISSSQYAADDFVVLEVQLKLIEEGELPLNELPEDELSLDELPPQTRVDIVAISARTQQTMTTQLLRHHDTFIARLPHLAEVWKVDISIDGEAGSSGATTSVIPYRTEAAASPLVRALVIGAPFLLALFVLVVYKRFGISLVS